MSAASRTARSHSLVIRLLIAQVAPLAIFAVVVLGVGAWTAHRIVADNADRLLAGALQTIRETVSVTDGTVTVEVAPWALALLDGPERDAVFYNVREGDRLVTGYVELPRLPEATTQAPVFADLSVRGVPVRMAQQQLAIPGRSALITVSVAQSLESRRASLRDLYRSMLLLPSLLVILAALLIWPALQWGTRSLNRLIDDLGRRRAPAGDFSPADIDLAPREFRPVLNAFNHLLAGLETSNANIQRFAADASHQLRTPLTVVAANLALLDTPDRRRTAQERRLLADSRTAVADMTRLIGQLLSTARADAARVPDTADLGRAVRRGCQMARERRAFPAKALRVRVPHEPVLVYGAEELIAEQLFNLIDNAFHHGAPPVFVNVSSRRAACSVTVWDHGQGVDDTLLPRLTERFYRPQATRSSGSGLGLSIVQALAVAQSTNFSLSNRKRRQGLVARLVFRSS